MGNAFSFHRGLAQALHPPQKLVCPEGQMHTESPKGNLRCLVCESHEGGWGDTAGNEGRFGHVRQQGSGPLGSGWLGSQKVPRLPVA